MNAGEPVATMHLVFVNYYSFACNSAGHIVCLANELIQLGHEVTVLVPFGADTASRHGATRFEIRTFDQVDAWIDEKRPASGNTLVIAWTPRENVRRFVSALGARIGCPYVVHLEDNEKLLTAVNLGTDFETLARLPEAELDQRMAVDERLSHPTRFPGFVAAAAGVTALIDRLLELAPTQRRTHVFWPGYNPAFFGPRPRNEAGRAALGIAPETTVLVYAGNVHSSNVAEVRSLYLAVCVLNRKGRKTLLVRAGEDYVPVLDHTLNEAARHVIGLGPLGCAETAALTAMADFLVQPGRSDAFNDYRVPSKLPEFFVTGRPVLLPATNLGRYVRDGEDAIVLQRGDALEIADQVEELRAEPERCARLAANAQAFAEKHFRWPEIARGLGAFYATVSSQSR